jgi:hypothetical protein
LVVDSAAAAAAAAIATACPSRTATTASDYQNISVN